MGDGLLAKVSQAMTSSQALVGIDIGGTRVKAVLVSPTGQILAKRTEPSLNDAAALIRLVEDTIQSLAPKTSVVGICAPGIAAPDNHSIAWMRGRMQVVEGLDWRQLERDVWVLNDAHAATLAESWVGAAHGKSHAVMITLGTGVGGGVIVSGRLLQGATGRAGHLGHLSLNMDGSPDIVGMPGSLEDMIGDHTIGQRSQGKFSSTNDLLEAVKRGDESAVHCWGRSIRSLAVGVASLINAFDPEVVVVGGGIAQSGSSLFDFLAIELDKVEWRPTGRRVPVVPAQLGELAGALGAARFAVLNSEETFT